MKIKDFLIETAKENKELISLANAALWDYKKNPRREISLSDISQIAISEPAVEELIKFIKIKFDSKFDRSLYNPQTKTILLKFGPELTLQSLKSVLVHELQHALDDLKSKGKFRNEKGDYLNRQSEVNARLSQVINDVEEALQKLNVKNIDWKKPALKSKMLRLIHSYMTLNQLTQKFGINDQRYRRLLNRIYQYLVNR